MQIKFMIYEQCKSKKLFFIVFISLFSSVFCWANNIKPSCSSIGKNKVCLVEYIDTYGERAYRLKLDNLDYYKISYYDNAELKKIDNKNLEITTSFSDRGSVDVSLSILLKANRPFLKTISSRSRINESPFGAIENCKVTINQYLSKDIDFYIEKYLFYLPDDEKSKVCQKIKLTN